MKAALWLRVSTEEQNTAKDETALRAYADRLGVAVTQVFDVTGSAWRGDHRAALEAMIAGAQTRAFDVLLFTDLTRISREGGVETLAILQKVLAAGVQVRTLVDSDFNGPLSFGQRLATYVKGELAYEDSLRKSAAVKRGMARAKAEGKQIGRPAGRKDTPGHKRPTGGYRLREAKKRVERLSRQH